MITFPHGIVPEEYLPEFLRGYIEADASLSLKSSGEAGIYFEATCYEFLRELNKVIARLANVREHTITSSINGAKQTDCGGGFKSKYKISWSGREDSKQILMLIYGDVKSNLFMNRKYKRSQLMLELIDIPRKQRKAY